MKCGCGKAMEDCKCFSRQVQAETQTNPDDIFPVLIEMTDNGRGYLINSSKEFPLDVDFKIVLTNVSKQEIKAFLLGRRSALESKTSFCENCKCHNE